MRNAALLLLFVAFGYAAKSQRFTLLPQVGFENSKTKISYNQEEFSPLGVKFAPQAGLRLNYSSKKGHGFFIGGSTSRSIVSFNFADPETGRDNFSATTGNMQVRLEGGYQFSTKPLQLNKSKASSSNSSKTTEKKSCSYRSSNCGSRSAKQQASNKNNNSWVKIQPSVGMGYIPGVKSNITAEAQNGQTVYEYKAGNWTTAFIAGTAFEFGTGNTRQVTVSVNYFKGLGNLDEQTVSSVSSGKNVTTTLASATSGWNVRIGIPFTLKAKTKTEKKPVKQVEQRKSGCGQYRIIYRCTKSN